MYQKNPIKLFSLTDYSYFPADYADLCKKRIKINIYQREITLCNLQHATII
jgi:hypothetical protein